MQWVIVAVGTMTNLLDLGMNEKRTKTSEAEFLLYTLAFKTHWFISDCRALFTFQHGDRCCENSHPVQRLVCVGVSNIFLVPNELAPDCQ